MLAFPRPLRSAPALAWVPLLVVATQGSARRALADPALEPPAAAGLEAVRIALPRALARRGWGRDGLERGIRETLEGEVGRLIGPRALAEAARALGVPRARRTTPAALAAAAEHAGADWVLRVQVKRDGWLYTARALLIRTDTAEVQMDFRSQYYKPASEARDRGQRIALRSLQKLATLLDERAIPPGLAARLPAPSNAPDAPPAVVGADDRAEPDGASPDRRTALEGEVSTGKATGEAHPRPPDSRAAPPDARDSRAPSEPAAGSRLAAAASPRAGAPAGRVLRASLTAGAALLRTYDLSAPGLDRSALSHRLDPLSLFDLRAALRVPGTPLVVEARGALRPVRYEVPAGATASHPSGLFLDSRLMLGWSVALSEGTPRRGGVELIPSVGARLGLARVDEHPGPFLVDATALVGLAALTLRVPLNDTLEVDLGVDGGPILVYEESPGLTGESGIGLSVGGDLSARLWLTESLAIALDSRFTYDQIGFSGDPSRPVPFAEQAVLRDATLGVRDLRASLGVAYRI